jgi:hypothetical protein
VIRCPLLEIQSMTKPQQQPTPSPAQEKATMRPATAAQDPEAGEARIILAALLLAATLMLACGVLNFVARWMGW